MVSSSMREKKGLGSAIIANDRYQGLFSVIVVCGGQGLTWEVVRVTAGGGQLQLGTMGGTMGGSNYSRSR